MSTKVQIVKRLEVIKNLIELEDEDTIHIQIDKLKSFSSRQKIRSLRKRSLIFS
jgi:hypothetical protein